MDKKHITAMIKLYEKECAEKEPYSFTDILEHYVDVERIYKKYVLPQKTTLGQINEWRLLYKFPLSHFIYMSFKNMDIEMLHNTLYQRALWCQVGIAHWGLVPESMFDRYIIPLLSAYKTDSIALAIPEEWGLCDKSNLSGGIHTNALRAIWYDDTELKAQVKLQAEKFLSKKNTKKDMYTTLYLLSLLDENIELANTYLNKVCIADRASKDFGLTKFDRSFSIFTHALYNLGQVAFNGKLKEKIEKPIQPNFSLELATYQESLPLNSGSMVINYDEPYTLINKITSTFPPKRERVQAYIDGQPWNVLSTHQPSKEYIETRYGADYRMRKSKEFHINCERYNEAVTELVLLKL